MHHFFIILLKFCFLFKNCYSQWKIHQNVLKHLFRCFNLHKTSVVLVATAIGTVIVAISAASMAEFNAPAFDCRVGTCKF